MAILQGLTNEAYDRRYTDRELIGRILAYFRVWQRRFGIIVTALFVQSLALAVAPILISRGLDSLAQGGDPWLLTVLVGGTLLSGVFVWALNWIQRRLTAMLLADVVLAMRSDAFRAVMGLDMSFFDTYQSGRIVSRITSDTDEFGRVAIVVTEVVSQLLMAILLIVVLLAIEWRLALLLLTVTPTPLIVAIGFRRLARRSTQASQQAVAEVNVSIQEAVTGISVAKNFRREQGIYTEFEGVNALSYTANVRRGLIASTIFPVLNAVGGLTTALVIYAGGMSVLAGSVTAGDWYLFVSSMGYFWFPMTNLSAFWSQLQGALSATERVFALMDTPSDVRQVDNQPVTTLKGEIEFRGVGFGYADREWVLDDFNLHIRPGESVALVGHTGAGKSSIAKLVTRFYEFQTGELLIDGQDIRRFDLHSYRQALGIVSQVPFLFDGTVGDNIRYGAPHLTDEMLEEVTRQIGGDWLETLPNGLQTDVGERGSRLSLGQRQLVVLARVLAQNPAIFILDEATASIDPFTESQIQKALELILKQRTSIAIAHRLSTVKAADRILVLDHGKIIEEGNHESLMARGGHYAELYDTYFRHQSLAYIESRARTAATA